MLQSPSSATKESAAMRSHGTAARGVASAHYNQTSSNKAPAQSKIIQCKKKKGHKFFEEMTETGMKQ